MYNLAVNEELSCWQKRIFLRNAPNICEGVFIDFPKYEGRDVL